MALPHGVESAAARLLALVALESPDPAVVFAALTDTALGVTSLSPDQLNSLQAVLGHAGRTLQAHPEIKELDAARLGGAVALVSELVAEQFRQARREQEAADRQTRLASARTEVARMLRQSPRPLTPGEILSAAKGNLRPDEVSRALAALCGEGRAERVEGPDGTDGRRRFYRAVPAVTGAAPAAAAPSPTPSEGDPAPAIPAPAIPAPATPAPDVTNRTRNPELVLAK